MDYMSEVLVNRDKIVNFDFIVKRIIGKGDDYTGLGYGYAVRTLAQFVEGCYREADRVAAKLSAVVDCVHPVTIRPVIDFGGGWLHLFIENDGSGVFVRRVFNRDGSDVTFDAVKIKVDYISSATNPEGIFDSVLDSDSVYSLYRVTDTGGYPAWRRCPLWEDVK